MNYDHLNTVYEFFRKDVLPNLTHSFNVDSFNRYLNLFSFLPSGKWLRDIEKAKLSRIDFAVDCKKLVRELKDKCVAYNTPIKPEDGRQRIIYQISPTLHIEVTVWIWMEQKDYSNMPRVLAAYNDEQEFLRWVDDIYKRMRKRGNTEDVNNPGFADTIKSMVNPS